MLRGSWPAFMSMPPLAFMSMPPLAAVNIQAQGCVPVFAACMIGGKLILIWQRNVNHLNLNLNLPMRARRFFGYCTLIITIIGLLSTGIAQIIACRWVAQCILFGCGCPVARHLR